MKKKKNRELYDDEFVSYVVEEYVMELGQAELARRLGCHPSYISKVLRREEKPGPKIFRGLGFKRRRAFKPED